MEEIQKDSKLFKLYYAVSGTGQGMIFLGRPFRDEHFKVWQGQIVSCITMVVSLFEANGFHLPNLKWSDEPVQLELNLKQI